MSARRRSRTRMMPPVAKLILATVCVVILVSAFFVFRANQRGPGIDESGVVTVLSVTGGSANKYRGRFVHRVRLESGPEVSMTFGQVFPRGARIWVSYRRYPKSQQLRVYNYVRRDD